MVFPRSGLVPSRSLSRTSSLSPVGYQGGWATPQRSCYGPLVPTARAGRLPPSRPVASIRAALVRFPTEHDAESVGSPSVPAARRCPEVSQGCTEIKREREPLATTTKCSRMVHEAFKRARRNRYLALRLLPWEHRECSRVLCAILRLVSPAGAARKPARKKMRPRLVSTSQRLASQID